MLVHGVENHINIPVYQALAAISKWYTRVRAYTIYRHVTGFQLANKLLTVVAVIMSVVRS